MMYISIIFIVCMAWQANAASGQLISLFRNAASGGTLEEQVETFITESTRVSAQRMPQELESLQESKEYVYWYWQNRYALAERLSFQRSALSCKAGKYTRIERPGREPVYCKLIGDSSQIVNKTGTLLGYAQRLSRLEVFVRAGHNGLQKENTLFQICFEVMFSVEKQIEKKPHKKRRRKT